MRFELDDDGGVIACQDLYTHPPGKHEGVLVNTYRVALERFGDERPKLTFIDPPDGELTRGAPLPLHRPRRARRRSTRSRTCSTTIADDTLVQRGLEADLGLPQGALDRKDEG